MQSAGAPIDRITEAWPSTTNHFSEVHKNGRAIDITVKDPQKAAAITQFINSQPGFKAANEYATKYRTTTGNNIHIAYYGKKNT